MGEDSGEDEDYDDFDATRGLPSAKGLSLPGDKKSSKNGAKAVSSALNSKYQLMTCSTSSKSGATNNDDIYLNNGNIDLKLPEPKASDTKFVEAESPRGATQKLKKTKTLKRRAAKLDTQEDLEGGQLTSGGGKKKRRRALQKKRLIMNVAQTKYYVVRYVGKKVYKMKLSRSEEEDWDVCWQDGAVQCEQLQRMKPYQRINHFPGMYALARKNHLARNLMRMQKIFPDDYKFFP
jgi:Tubulin-tyrosine ligase family